MAVKGYVKRKSWSRAMLPQKDASYKANVAWNGEVPLMLNRQPACAAHPPFKRDDTPVCVNPDATPSSLPTSSVATSSGLLQLSDMPPSTSSVVPSSTSSVNPTSVAASVASQIGNNLSSLIANLPTHTEPPTTTSMAPAPTLPSIHPNPTSDPPQDPSATLPASAARATCDGVDQDGQTTLRIWTNYTNDGGSKLHDAVVKACKHISEVLDWTGGKIPELQDPTWQGADGVVWTANMTFSFHWNISLPATTKTIDCIKGAILASEPLVDTNFICPHI